MKLPLRGLRAALTLVAGLALATAAKAVSISVLADTAAGFSFYADFTISGATDSDTGILGGTASVEELVPGEIYQFQVDSSHHTGQFLFYPERLLNNPDRLPVVDPSSGGSDYNYDRSGAAPVFIGARFDWGKPFPTPDGGGFLAGASCLGLMLFHRLRRQST